MENNPIRINQSILIASMILTAVFLSGCASPSRLVKVSVNETASNTTETPKPTGATVSSGQKASSGVASTQTASAKPSQKEVLVPDSYALKVAFASQAPLSNWDVLHEETCEEASMVMAEKYFNNQPLTPQIMEDELQALVKWEEENGYSVDLTAAEAAKIMNEEMGVKAEVVAEVTVDRIKYEIYKGNLVIIPAAGRLLGNPNFTGAGPVYHMLLIKGYTDSQFITNDPGTRKGNGYIYDYSILLNAVHDWNPKLIGADGKMSDANMAKGAKIMIVVSKKIGSV